MIKAVLFDLDNTLIDFMRMKRMAIDHALDAMIEAGLEMKKKEAEKLLYSIYDEFGIEDQKVFQKFLKEAEGKVDYKKLAYAVIAYRRIKESFLTPYPGTKQTLIQLKQKGLMLAIISDAPALQAWSRLVQMGLDDFFDSVVTFDDTKEKKPAKKPFLKTLWNLGLGPDECLMIGDWPERDICGAKALGMKTVFARYGCVSEPKSDGKPDYMIDDIRKLCTIVDRLLDTDK